VCTKTASQPGEPITDSNAFGRRIGAFVTVGMRGMHALTAGHGLREKHQIRHSNGNKSLGMVEVVRCTDEIVEGTCDAALFKLNGGASTFVHVDDYVVRSLSMTCKRPLKDLAVEKYSNDPNRVTRTVKYPDYTRYDETGAVIAARCFAIVSPNDEEYFHENGESGLIITTVPPSDGNATVSDQIVNPVGMLVSTDFLEKTNDNRGICLSVAVPFGRTLHQLSKNPYCNNGSLALIGVDIN